MDSQDGDAGSGKIIIIDGRLRFDDISRNTENILRSINLSGASSAILSFDWQTFSLDGSGDTNSEQLSIQISTDGITYTTLDKLTGSPSTGSFSQNITAYISPTTTFRFYNESSWSYGDWEPGEYVYIEDFLITAVPIVVSTSDVDSDGILDINDIDIDNDNDGIPDCFEDGAEDTTISDVFSVNGDASEISNFEAQLTPNAYTQAGSMHITDRIDFTKSFDFSFEAYLGNDNNGADGIAIVFHNDPSGEFAVGVTGEGMGSQGIADGIVLELDTYYNSSRGDITNDHGMIWDSDNQTGVGLLTTAVDLGNLEDGLWHDVQIIWNSATNTIAYYVDSNLAGSFTNDIVTNYFGGENLVYFGFTASTGGSRNDQRIRFNDLCEIPLFVDDDGDGIPNYLDLDSDNDGIYDVVEGGDGALDTNNDGQINASDTGYADADLDGQADASVDADETPDTDNDDVADFIDFDSDNDGCFDAVEALGSFTTGDLTTSNNLADDDEGTVDAAGVPTNTGSPQGTSPAVTTAASTNITTQPLDQSINAGSNVTFSVAVTSNGGLTYQWQESTNNGVSWSDITDGGSNPSVTGSATANLTLTDVPLTYNTYMYRVIIINNNDTCTEVTSGDATLEVNVETVITNRRITHRVNRN